MMTEKLIVFKVVLAMLVALAHGDDSLNLDTIKDNITGLLGNLPNLPNLPTDLNELSNIIPEFGDLPNLKDFNLPDMGNVNMPDIQKVLSETEQLFKDKCAKESGSDAAYEEAKEGVMTFGSCVSDLFDVNEVMEEIEKAKPTGDLDEVFNKYCRKRHIALDCLKNLTLSVSGCLDEEEAKQKDVFREIAEKLLEFVCYKDGDHIALFIAEKGPECFNQTHQAIFECFNETFGGYVPKTMPTLDDLPKLILKEKECKDIERLQICVTSELEKCEESTPANIMESLFRFVKKKGPCAQYFNSSGVNRGAFEIVAGAMLMMILTKFFMVSV